MFRHLTYLVPDFERRFGGEVRKRGSEEKSEEGKPGKEKEKKKEEKERNEVNTKCYWFALDLTG